MLSVVSFIGSDKNAGKTTALMHEYHHEIKEPCVLTSIGINGEEIDQYETHCKPAIRLKQFDFAITALRHTRNLNSRIRILDVLTPPRYSRAYVLLQAQADLNLILEGPNERWEFTHLRQDLQALKNCTLLIDGSIDRQFLAHPEVSDSLRYALYLSTRAPQWNKAMSLIAPLFFAPAKRIMPKDIQESAYALLNPDGSVILKSQTPALLCSKLAKYLTTLSPAAWQFYCNGAYVKSLHEVIIRHKPEVIILDNITCWQMASVSEFRSPTQIEILRPAPVTRFYVRQERPLPLLPKGIPVINLFRRFDV